MLDVFYHLGQAWSFFTAVLDKGINPLSHATVVMKEESVGMGLVTAMTRGVTNTGCSFSSLLLLVTGMVLHSKLITGVMSPVIISPRP